MTEAEQLLDRRAVELLLSIAETPDATISGTALDDYYPSAGTLLKKLKLIKDKGHDPVSVSLADHDDAPVSLVWSPENKS